MATLEETKTEIALRQEQAQQQQALIDKYQQAIPQTNQQQLRGQVQRSGSMNPLKALLQRRKFAKAREQAQKAEQEVQNYIHNLQSYNQQLQEYQTTDSGKLQYAKEQGVQGKPIYGKLGRGYAQEVLAYEYETPYGKVTDYTPKQEALQREAKTVQSYTPEETIKYFTPEIEQALTQSGKTFERTAQGEFLVQDAPKSLDFKSIFGKQNLSFQPNSIAEKAQISRNLSDIRNLVSQEIPSIQQQPRNIWGGEIFPVVSAASSQSINLSGGNKDVVNVSTRKGGGFLSNALTRVRDVVGGSSDFKEGYKDEIYNPELNAFVSASPTGAEATAIIRQPTVSEAQAISKAQLSGSLFSIPISELKDPSIAKPSQIGFGFGANKPTIPFNRLDTRTTSELVGSSFAAAIGKGYGSLFSDKKKTNYFYEPQFGTIQRDPITGLDTPIIKKSYVGESPSQIVEKGVRFGTRFLTFFPELTGGATEYGIQGATKGAKNVLGVTKKGTEGFFTGVGKFAIERPIESLAVMTGGIASLWGPAERGFGKYVDELVLDFKNPKDVRGLGVGKWGKKGILGRQVSVFEETILVRDIDGIVKRMTKSEAKAKGLKPLSDVENVERILGDFKETPSGKIEIFTIKEKVNNIKKLLSKAKNDKAKEKILNIAKEKYGERFIKDYLPDLVKTKTPKVTAVDVIPESIYSGKGQYEKTGFTQYSGLRGTTDNSLFPLVSARSSNGLDVLKVGETNFLSSQDFGQNVLAENLSKTKQKNLQTPFLGSLQKSNQDNQQKNKQTQFFRSLSATESLSDIKLDQKNLQRLRTSQSTRQDQRLRLRTRVGTPRVTKTKSPDKPNDPLKIRPFGLRQKPKKKRVVLRSKRKREEFLAITKRYGKEKVIGLGRTPQEAVAIGKRNVLGTLGATLKVKTRSGKSVALSPDRTFRTSKTDPLAIVQRQRTPQGGRLASLGERMEIKSRRRKVFSLN